MLLSVQKGPLRDILLRMFISRAFLASMSLATFTGHLMIQKNIPGSFLPTGISAGTHWAHGAVFILICRNDAPLLPAWEPLCSATACTDGEGNQPGRSILQPSLKNPI